MDEVRPKSRPYSWIATATAHASIGRHHRRASLGTCDRRSVGLSAERLPDTPPWISQCWGVRFPWEIASTRYRNQYPSLMPGEGDGLHRCGRPVHAGINRARAFPVCQRGGPWSVRAARIHPQGCRRAHDRCQSERAAKLDGRVSGDSTVAMLRVSRRRSGARTCRGLIARLAARATGDRAAANHIGDSGASLQDASFTDARSASVLARGAARGHARVTAHR